jgi:hypothetical protein
MDQITKDNLDQVLGPNRKERTNAATYVGLYPLLRDEAAMHGYALAVHGSMARDFDLIAVPWVENPSSAEVLVQSLCGTIGGKVRTYNNEGGKIVEQPTVKPHSRLAWTIHFGGGPYIDLSVIQPKQ